MDNLQKIILGSFTFCFFVFYLRILFSFSVTNSKCFLNQLPSSENCIVYNGESQCSTILQNPMYCKLNAHKELIDCLKVIQNTFNSCKLYVIIDEFRRDFMDLT